MSASPIFLSPYSEFYYSPDTCWGLKLDVSASDLLEDGLNDVMEGLTVMEQEMQKTRFQNKRDSWKDAESWRLIHDYLVNSQLPLKFCTEVNGFTEPYTDKFSNRSAVRPMSIIIEMKDYMRTLLGLKDYFGDISTFRSKWLIGILKGSQAKMKKLDDKLDNVQMLRKLSTILFVIMLGLILMGSVVVTVVKLPPVMTPLLAAATIPLAAIWKWFASKYRKCERCLKEEREIFNAMQTGCNIVSEELASVAVVIDRLHIQNEAFQVFYDSGNNQDSQIAMDKVNTMLDEFDKTIDNLAEQANRCVAETKSTRKICFRLIINQHDI